jgi:hypothetical protein
MKQTIRVATMVMAVWLTGFGVGAAAMDVDVQVLQEKQLEATPLDTAISADGKLVFVLSPGEIRVHAPDGQLLRKVPVDTGYDRIQISNGDRLVLTGSENRRLQILELERVFPITIGDHPVLGPADAPVTIAVFDDYQ